MGPGAALDARAGRPRKLAQQEATTVLGPAAAASAGDPDARSHHPARRTVLRNDRGALMFAAIGRGAAAGAAGTAALNAVTYLDMAVRARPSSSTPQRAVELLAERAGRPVPGDGEERENRLQGLGALSGIATGVGIGVCAGLLAPLLDRLPLPLAGGVLGAGAMAATDVPMAGLGLTDPRSWSRSDWLSDAVPHLAYGLVTMATFSVLRRARRSRRASGTS